MRRMRPPRRPAPTRLRVRRPCPAEVAGVKPGAAVVAIMDPYEHLDALTALADAGVSAFAMELVPRITRAQSMDVLSSQTDLAGYRAIIDAAAAYAPRNSDDDDGRRLGAARAHLHHGRRRRRPAGHRDGSRIGGVVTATDVRPATKEQVLSCRAKKFIAVEDEESRRRRDGGRLRQADVGGVSRQAGGAQAAHIAKQDIVVTTALELPARRAPVLITAEMVRSMRPGSVIIDLAAERGGNCELTQPGETLISENSIKIIGALNLAGRVPATASFLYSKNLVAFLQPLIDPAAHELAIDWNDEIVKATLLTKDGALVHPNFQAPAEPVAQ